MHSALTAPGPAWCAIATHSPSDTRPSGGRYPRALPGPALSKQDRFGRALRDPEHRGTDRRASEALGDSHYACLLRTTAPHHGENLTGYSRTERWRDGKVLPCQVAGTPCAHPEKAAEVAPRCPIMSGRDQITAREELRGLEESSTARVACSERAGSVLVPGRRAKGAYEGYCGTSRATRAVGTVVSRGWSTRAEGARRWRAVRRER